jgi:hypothetical protein
VPQPSIISASPGLSLILAAVVEGLRWLFRIAGGAMEFNGCDDFDGVGGSSWRSLGA